MPVLATVDFQGAIFDVGGVLVDSPHERAWREALRELMEGEWSDVRGQTTYSPERFTHEVYLQVMADMPRLAGARGALEYFGVPGAGRRVEEYAAVKQEHVVKLIEMGEFAAFADALRFIMAVNDLGIPVAAASLSKNAKLFLRLSVISRPGRASPIKILVRDETRVLAPGTRADFRHGHRSGAARARWAHASGLRVPATAASATSVRCRLLLRA